MLIEALAPDLMVGWPGPLSDDAKALLPDSANHPRIPRLTGRDDVTDKIKALTPDLIIDYGEVTPRYFHLAQATQQKTGIPTLLFSGSLDNIPRCSSVGGYFASGRARRKAGDLRRSGVGVARETVARGARRAS